MVPEALFDFLTDLAANNDRAWFAANKHRYEACIKAPLLRLIEDFALPLHSISPHCLAVPKIGGSLFRIYRDVRFSKDKSPFKTYAGVHFRHSAGKGAHSPGFYLHLEPGDCFAAAGIWGPDTKTLTLIRQTIADDPQHWMAVKASVGDTLDFSLHAERLKRMPRGFKRDQPCESDIRRKHFIGARQLSRSQVLDPGFPELLLETYTGGAPLMKFLTGAIGLPW